MHDADPPGHLDARSHHPCGRADRPTNRPRASGSGGRVGGPASSIQRSSRAGACCWSTPAIRPCRASRGEDGTGRGGARRARRRDPGDRRAKTSSGSSTSSSSTAAFATAVTGAMAMGRAVARLAAMSGVGRGHCHSGARGFARLDRGAKFEHAGIPREGRRHDRRRGCLSRWPDRRRGCGRAGRPPATVLEYCQCRGGTSIAWGSGPRRACRPAARWRPL